MPMLTHEQIHVFLVGVAGMQKVNGDVFAQTEFTDRGKFSHSHYVAALHDIAGTGEPKDVQQLLACMTLARMTPHPPERVAQNDAWELAQVRRLDAIREHLRANRDIVHDIICTVPGVRFRTLPDPAGDLCTHLVVIFPDAASAAARPECQRQPMASPHSTSAASDTTALSRSATLRPTTTADDAIGIERNRSVTPRATSFLIAWKVPSRPKTMVSASVPGIRNSR